MYEIEAKDIKKSFGNLEVLKSISLQVNKGEVVAILGSSGSGKSTFLRSLIDLETVDGGSISIAGENLCKDGVYVSKKEKAKALSKAGMVFQHFNLFPHMSIRKNLMCAPLLNKQGTKEEISKLAESTLAKVGLLDKIDAMPSTLSGGQKQRVAIARALMRNPEIILFDEPTSALDPELTGEVLSVMSDLAKEGITMLIVTHEIGFAAQVADKIMFMDKGYVIDYGTPEDVIINPKNERIKTFEEKMKKTIGNLDGELSAIRAGRANPNVLNKIVVDYYGTPTPIQQVANVSVPEARMIQIQPWEKSMVREIEKAIMTSDLGINPTNDGTTVRLLFPELTEDRRKELVKDVKKKGEAAKVAIRNIRRDGIDAAKKLKGTDVSEDEIKDMEDDLQKLTDKYVKEVDKAVESKSKEVMTV